jgi:Carboxypeptidase regulatory-like domain
MRFKQLPCLVLLCLPALFASAQELVAPTPQPSSLVGIIADSDDASVPGATISVDGPSPSEHHIATADQDGSFAIPGLHPAVSYHVTVSAQGFQTWSSAPVVLTPGQEFELPEVKLTIAAVDTSVNAVDAGKLAIEQIQAEEHQRVLGIIPNFYVSYDPRFAPMSTKLKYKLAFRTATDAVSIGAAAFVAGIDQAAANPAYVEGTRGYFERFGASYASGASDIILGGGVLPALLHQDPRYFYQGTGTTRSRAMHALASPFRAKGDNGQWQFNYSSIGGDLGAAALTNLYYPSVDRGAGLVFSNALITTGGRMLSALAQEFLLSRYTTKVKTKD